MDIRETSTEEKRLVAKVNTLRETRMQLEGQFCYDSDFIARQFGNFLYSIDGHSHILHVYSIKDKQWNFSPLRDLGILT